MSAERGGAAAGRVAPRATPWHATTVEACVAALSVDPAAGLATDEAARRLVEHGPNALPSPAPRTWIGAFVDQFKSVLVAFLAVAAVVVLALGQSLDAAAIVAILVLNAALGCAQERRAAEALAALRRLNAPDARVRRAGAVAVVPAATLVPGDVVLLCEGDVVPADLRLTRTADLRANEAVLTGESDAVAKNASTTAVESAALGDRAGVAWSGTAVAAGSGEGVVVATGRNTELGRIADLTVGVESPPTPLQTRLAAFGRGLAIACGAACVLVFALGVARGEPVADMFLAAVSLAVAAVPEGLPAVVTIALAAGVSAMARRRVLIRRLPAVETLGCTTVICSDKTGTLTVGEMTVRVVASLDFESAVDDGDACPDRARRVLRAAAACSTARLVEKEGRLSFVGDPTEGAIVVAASKAGVSADDLARDEPVVACAAFDARRMRMSVARRTSSGVRSYVKGAPEAVMDRCRDVVVDDGFAPLGDAERRRLLELNRTLADRGLRVLAVALRDLDGADPVRGEDDLSFLGFVGMQDPPRPTARDAVAACRAAGVRTAMITGDQPATALAVARDLGIARDASEVTTGPQIEAADDAALRARVATASVFARVSPEHKLRIVEALRARGEVVAMTGDGVNDAPALKGADIGVAMGRSGTDVAKAAAAMVVTDDDFASIVAAVAEGRRVFENIRKTLLYLLSGNLAEILVMTTAVVAGLPLPLLPVQLLWINFVTDGLPALALAVDPAEPDLLLRPPRRTDRGLADREFVGQVAWSALLVAATTFGAYAWTLRSGGSVDEARTRAFSVLVVAEVLRAFAARSRTKTLWEVGAASNARLAVCVAATIAVQIWSHRSGAWEHVLHTGPLSWSGSLATVALGAAPVTILEATKVLRRALGRGAES